MDRDKAYLAHITDEIAAIERFVAGMSLDAFMADEKTTHAIERSLEIIGGAAKSLSDDARARYPNIPWKDIAGIRDKIAHHYFDVDHHTLWDVIICDLPILKQALTK